MVFRGRQPLTCWKNLSWYGENCFGLGYRLREGQIALGAILIVVTYGHLLREALFDTTHHIFPRLVLLVITLTVPRERDLLSLDAWLSRRG